MASFSSPDGDQQGSSDTDEQKREDNKNITKYRDDIVSTLPRETEGGMHFFQIQGFWYKTPWAEGALWAQENFISRPSDIFLATFPKCGTTWLKSLIFAIINRDSYYPDQHSTKHPLLTTNPHNLVPFLEVQAYGDDPITHLESLPSPRLLAVHTAYSSLPKSITSSGPKIITITRDPKDVFVSYWIFMKKIRLDMNMPAVSIEVAFENFCRGICHSGPFWDFTLGYWRARLESPDNILFLRFEDMKKDTCFHVKKVAEFMGHPFSAEEEKKGDVEEIIKLCSFGNLKNLEVNNSGIYYIGNSGETVPCNAFFRRGEIGDSKNYLTAEMIKRLDQITEEKFKGTGLI